MNSLYQPPPLILSVLGANLHLGQRLLMSSNGTEIPNDMDNGVVVSEFKPIYEFVLTYRNVDFLYQFVAQTV